MVRLSTVSNALATSALSRGLPPLYSQAASPRAIRIAAFSVDDSEPHDPA